MSPLGLGSSHRPPGRNIESICPSNHGPTRALEPPLLVRVRRTLCLVRFPVWGERGRPPNSSHVSDRLRSSGSRRLRSVSSRVFAGLSEMSPVLPCPLVRRVPICSRRLHLCPKTADPTAAQSQRLVGALSRLSSRQIYASSIMSGFFWCYSTETCLAHPREHQNRRLVILGIQFLLA